MVGVAGGRHVHRAHNGDASGSAYEKSNPHSWEFFGHAGTDRASHHSQPPQAPDQSGQDHSKKISDSSRFVASKSALSLDEETYSVYVDEFSYEKELYNINKDSGRYFYKASPWMTEDGQKKAGWSWYRIMAAKLVLSQQVEWTMGGIIMFNLIIIIIETDQEAMCFPDYYGRVQECEHSSSNVPLFGWVNRVLLVAYTIEAALRIFVERIKFFTKGWNLLDFAIVFMGWVSEGLSAVISIEQIGWLRVLRIGRLFRAMRIFVSIKELHMLLTGLIGSMKAIFFGSMMLMGMLILFSILMVQYVHPINSQIYYDGCDRCSKGYQSVMSSTLTLFQQIVAGDSWGTISIPVIMEDPFLAIPLCVTLLTVGLGAMNLILAVIVDRAAEARESKGEFLIAQKINMQRQRRLELLEMFQAMDKDKSGTLSLQELDDAWKEPKSAFREMMSLMDLHQGDLKEIFESIDRKGSGEINYMEFCKNLEMVQSKDSRFIALLTQLRVTHLDKSIEKEVGKNRKMLHRHERLLLRLSDLLQAVDAKVSRLAGEDCHRSRPVEPEADKSMSISPSSRGISEATLDGPGREFALLQKQAINLDDLHHNVLCSAQEQAELMLRQREFVCSLNEALAEQASPEASAKLVEGVHDQLAQVLSDMQESLQAVVEELQDKLQNEADMLASNATLLDSIGEQLPGAEKRRRLSRKDTVEVPASRSVAPFGPRLDAPAKSALFSEQVELELNFMPEISDPGDSNDVQNR